MPGAKAVVTCQHREREKRFLSENGFPCAAFCMIANVDDLRNALATLPERGGILKTAEFGYDGKGQLPVAKSSDADVVWAQFDAPRAVLEEKIELAAELSVLVVRDQSGNCLLYTSPSPRD